MIQSPFDFFDRWYGEVQVSQIPQANSMTLVTSTQDGTPSARVVLLKDVQEGEFRFFTNYGSRKAKELVENPKAQLLFYWPTLGRQIRIEGVVSKTSAAASDAYWYTRPRESRIGAIASRQSHILGSMPELKARVAEVEKEFEGKEVPRPDFWGGFSLKPSRFEFWEDGAFRLHERIVYLRPALENGEWLSHRLSP
jgi:pyridoxamine 5'-phosphate oxidase